jgi:hypothetical protein
MAMANQSVHANNYPFTPLGGGISDLNYLGSAGLGLKSSDPTTSSPAFTFTCPPSGTYNLQWAFYDRNDPAIASYPTTPTATPYFTVTQAAAATPASTAPMYPADEVFIFKRPENREGYFAGNMFTNINSDLYQCEVRVDQPICGTRTVTPGAQLCDPNGPDPSCCTPCLRGTINFATLPDGSQVPASEVSDTSFMPGSIVGATAAQDYWARKGVHFNGTASLGLLSGLGSDENTGLDGWCSAGGYTCRTATTGGPNNVVLFNNTGSDPATGTPSVNTMQITFDQSQTSVAFDLSSNYLCTAASTTVQLKLAGRPRTTLTLVPSCPGGVCPAGTIQAAVPCSSSGAAEYCGRYIVSAPRGAPFDEVDVLPTTCDGATAACTITTAGHAGNCNAPPNCGTNYDKNCGGSKLDNLSFGSFGPGSRTVLFADGHGWFSGSFASNKYAELRSCFNDASLCYYNYEGPMDTDAACTNLSKDLDTTAAPPYTKTPLFDPVQPLVDVDGCFYGNNGSGTPVPATFTDGETLSPAYGVTTFFASYANGMDAFTGQTCPVSTAAPRAVGMTTATAAVCGGTSVTLDGSGSQSYPASGASSVPLSYTWTEQHNRVPPSSGTSQTYAFVAPHFVGTAQTLAFTLAVADACNTGDVQQQPVNVTVKNDNQAPTSQALLLCGGGDSGAVAHRAVVTLDGSKSFDPDGDAIASYSWVQTSGTAVMLNGADTAQPSFVAPGVDGTLTFALVVTDSPNNLECGGPLMSTPATATVTVESVPHSPAVSAGSPQTVPPVTPVTLSGSACSPDNDALTYSWTQPAGPSVALSGATTLSPTFISPPLSAPGTVKLTFQLTATDSATGLASSSTVDVFVYQPYAPPDCSHATASLGTLWPPDHKMINLQIQNVKDNAPEANKLTYSITRILQNEPTQGTGSGDTCSDASFSSTPVNAFQIRSERAGAGSGRVYRVEFSATDSYGGSCSGAVTVCVPHDLSHGGICPARPTFAYDSTVCY